MSRSIRLVPNTRDIALGLVLTGARAAAVTGRLVLMPVRVAAHVPLVGPVLRRAGDELASDGRSTRARARRQLEGAAGELLDAAVERAVLGWLRRPQAPASTGVRMQYGGIATRAIALAIDVAVALLIFLTGAALLGLVASLVAELRPAWLVATLIAAGWALVVGSYFVLFWTVAGQTPGMRMMRLRLAEARGEPPRLGRSVVRLLGLGIAIVPLFAGLVPVLVDDRRRGLHDFLAGAVVISTGRTLGHALEVRASVAGAASPGEPSPELPTESAGG